MTGCQFKPPAIKLPIKLPFAAPQVQTACPGQTIGILIGADDDPIAIEQRAGYELALQEINADGGPGGCQLSLVYEAETSTGSQNQIHKAVRALVEDDKAIAILGGTASSASMHAASLVNYFATPLIIPATSGSHVLPNENHWAYRLNATDTIIGSAIIDLVKQELGAGKKFTIVFEDSTQGHDIAFNVANLLTLYEQQLVGYFPYETESTDFGELTDAIAESKPDILYLVLSQPEDARALMEAINDSDMPLPLMTFAHGGGFLSEDFLFTEEGEIDPLAENLIIAKQWTRESDTKAGKAVLQAFAEYDDKNDQETKPPSVYNLAAYKSLHVVAAALATGLDNNIVTWSDAAKIREILRQELSSYQEDSAFWGAIDFDTGGQDQASVALIQILDGEAVVVYPLDDADQSPVINLSALEEATPTPTPNP